LLGESSKFILLRLFNVNPFDFISGEAHYGIYFSFDFLKSFYVALPGLAKNTDIDLFYLSI
jgi:hypothetical protein